MERDQYKEFMKDYDIKHQLCPKCGERKHWITLMGYILTNNEEYKNLNKCRCQKCGDIHTKHERISYGEFRDSKLNQIIT